MPSSPSSRSSPTCTPGRTGWRRSRAAAGSVALAGGAGRAEALSAVWTWQRLGPQAKPVALYDVDGFWQSLLAMLDRMVATGFLSPRFRGSLIVGGGPADLLEQMARWQPQAPKWAGPADEDAPADAPAAPVGP